MVFGGDGEDRIDPDIVEVIWPGYDDGFDDSGYVHTGYIVVIMQGKCGRETDNGL